MINKSRIKFIKSLQLKKFRQAEGLFVAEGQKLVQELLASHWQIESLYYTTDHAQLGLPNAELCSMADMARMSGLKKAPGILAVVQQNVLPNFEQRGMLFALDGIRDPGNLGTLIRCADWFGMKQLICSTDTVDLYNPKVVQATMGSLWRVDVHYVELKDYLTKGHKSTYGLDMSGSSIYAEKIEDGGIIVLGNESLGIREELRSCIQHFISIPGSGNAESLNASISGAIVMSELHRRASEKA